MWLSCHWRPSIIPANMKLNVAVISFLMCFSMLSGCAYKLKGTQRQIPGGYQTISIPVFVNSTQETGIEVNFTNAITQQFHRSKVADLVDDSFADVKVLGVINSLSFEPQGKKDSAPMLPKGTILATEYRVVAGVTLSLVRSSDRQILWTSSFRSETTYSAPQVTASVVNTVNPLYNQSARRQAIESLSQDMMAEAHNLMTESF